MADTDLSVPDQVRLHIWGAGRPAVPGEGCPRCQAARTCDEYCQAGKDILGPWHMRMSGAIRSRISCVPHQGTNRDGSQCGPAAGRRGGAEGCQENE